MDKEIIKKTGPTVFSPNLIGQIADEVSKTLISRLPSMLMRPRQKKKPVKKPKKIENAILLDTSAIIDGRIFDVIYLGLLNGIIVLPPSILLELKHIADSQDTVKRERGRKGLEALGNFVKPKRCRWLCCQMRKRSALAGKWMKS